MKSCTFLGIPLKCFNSDIAWGVLLIDSIKWHEKFESIAREIENITENYSVFF